MRILFFDGYCSLCNGLVDWVMSQDKRQKIQFASLQGQTAKKFIPNFNLNDNDTVVYWSEGNEYQRSSAILNVLADLGGAWKLVRIFFIIPESVRNSIYRWVAAHRYRFFTRRDTCRIPNENEKSRLLP